MLARHSRSAAVRRDDAVADDAFARDDAAMIDILLKNFAATGTRSVL